MRHRSRELLLLLMSAGSIAVLALVLIFWRGQVPSPQPSARELALSALVATPEWSTLNAFQNTITRNDFETLLHTQFTTGKGWHALIQTDDHGARIHTGLPPPNDIFHLSFITPSQASPVPRYWRATKDFPPAPQGHPLAGIHIALDPGHLGGTWASMEGRCLQLNSNPPVCEGNLTLQVAHLLKPRLEALGAKVSLVRKDTQPLTPLRPQDLLTMTKIPAPANSSAAAQQAAELMFYRTAEIHARAQFVNHSLQPDLVICLHFNAEHWGDPNNPVMVDRSHLHLLVSGAFSDDEVSLPDQRFELLHKLLQHAHEEEVRIGASVAETMAAATGLPPFQYPPKADNVRPISNQPYLWARNLLANRLYQCPVIFMEPYVMNSSTDYARIVAGDYDGQRLIAGKLRPSIFREYAEGIVTGLTRHYSSHRKTKP